MNANVNTSTLIDSALIESSNTLSRKVIINVDDLGLSEPVNEAVLNLAYKRLITASSYMVAGHIDTSSIKALHAAHIDIGLHLDFTGIFDTTIPKKLSTLLKASYLRRIDSRIVTNDIKQQLDIFEETFNHPPRFIDGHQHVHQFPIIRECLITELTHRYGEHIHGMASRATYPINYDIKAWIIYGLGGNKWQHLCQQASLVTNSHFGGVYNFSATEEKLAELWDSWLSKCPIGIGGFNTSSNIITNTPTDAINNNPVSVIMCHPAVADNNWQDEIKEAREREYRFMMNGKLKHLYDRHYVELTHWHHLYKTPKRPI